jgi:M6 family metalloprotease-like protein
MFNLKSPISVLLSSILVLFSLSVAPSYAAVKSGATCKKAGATVTRSGTKLECVRKSGKLVWSKPRKSAALPQKVESSPTPSVAASPTPSPTTSKAPTVEVSASPTPSPSPTSPVIQVRKKAMAAPTPGIATYRGGAGNAKRPNEMSFELPVNVTPPPNDANVKLWVYDPDNKARSLGSPGVFFQKDGGEWILANSNPDGSVYATWSTGTYAIDSIEPGGRVNEFARKRYMATVDSKGEFLINGLDPNSRGFYTLTINKVGMTPGVAPKPKFVPATACQLEDRTENFNIAVGFPKRDNRLPSEGRIDALVIPVDFEDVPGKGDPEELFRVMTDETARFFYSQSDGRVQFNFQSLDNWVRAPFKSDAFRLGGWNNGDPTGYYSAVLKLADPLVDYSLFDVVYVLSPKETPSTSIAYGPAFPMMPGDDLVLTNDGMVFNGTISGADAWMNLAGAGWKWMAHETGHLFGLHDLYVIGGASPYGAWDIMSLNWSIEAIALNAWNRYIQGWLSENQLRCLERTDLAAPVEVALTPIERESDGIKAALVPLSPSKILVIESRRSEGYDTLTEAQAGVLVYTVDMTVQSIKGGWQTQRRPGSNRVDFMDATLKAGDEITVDGLKITVISRDVSGDLIRLSRN